MKIFSWMQSKLNGKQVTKNSNTGAANHHMGQATSKEEFSDWPQSLLAIGTFGLSNLRADPEPEAPHSQTPTPEEDSELHEEFISYLDTQEDDEEEEESETHPSEKTVGGDLLLNKDVSLQRSISGMFSIGKEILVDKKNNVIRKKSLTFLLKKIFKSRNRFNLRDSLPDPTFEKSRMEKILRAILNKKIHPQSSTTKAISDKYLVRKKDMYMGESDDEDDIEGSIWVKTDSEYIVLEI